MEMGIKGICLSESAQQRENEELGYSPLFVVGHGGGKSKNNNEHYGIQERVQESPPSSTTSKRRGGNPIGNWGWSSNEQTALYLYAREFKDVLISGQSIPSLPLVSLHSS